MIEQTKLRAGKYKLPATLTYKGDRIFIQFKFSRALIAEVKAMRGNRWHGFDKPPKKVWSIENCPRNLFQLAYLKGENPYAHYDLPTIEHEYIRPLYSQQKEFSNFILTRRHCVIAGEIGIGKTLGAIEAMERSGHNDWWYIAPHSGLRAVERELRIWKSKIQPRMMTYAALVKVLKESEGTEIKAPQGVIFDESSRAKNPTTQRSQAAMMLADGIRSDWGYDGYIVLMSGAPAPKDPCDWYWQCEIACPGFLKEGTQMKMRKRLAVIVEKETVAGGVYPSLETWLDNTNKCAICGQKADSANHDVVYCEESDLDFHYFKKSENEVVRLSKRMSGLVLVRLKKNCLDLPDIHYRRIILEPTQKTLNLARTILKTAKTVISGITSFRTLSDGFQYRKEQDGEEDCKICNGSGEIESPIDDGEIINCDGCTGGKVPIIKRTTIQVDCPKEEAFIDILDEHLDVGRLVVYAGFTGAIDRCVQVARNVGWEIIRADGRGWWASIPEEVDHLDLFQDMQEKYPRVVFIGQPGAAGMGITLTASPTILYYSNTFNGEDRIQSEGRGHRPGMDLIKGLTVIDLIHLPTDELVLDNLVKKRKLQALTMNDLSKALG